MSSQLEFYLQYAGGNSRPNQSPDRSEGWYKFFNAQTLLSDGDGNRLVIKTSEITPTGLMWIHASKNSTTEKPYVDDLTPQEFTKHLMLVGVTLKEMRAMYPQSKIALWHINATDEVTFKKPGDLGNPPLDIPTKNSQTIGTLHSHCDVFDGDNFSTIHSLKELVQIHATRLDNLGTDPQIIDESMRNFLLEKKRQIKISVFSSIAKKIWEGELVPKLLDLYPEIFYPLSKDVAAATTAQGIAIGLIKGLKSFNDDRFSDAICNVHSFTKQSWGEISTLISALQRQKRNCMDEMATYQANHPWILGHERHIRLLVNLIKDRSAPPDTTRLSDEERSRVLKSWDKEKANWLHKGFNYTLGVADWRDYDPVFFLNIAPHVNMGVESVRIHSIREPHELNLEERAVRLNFRSQVMKRLRSKIPGLKVGPEGEYTLMASDQLLG